MSTPLTPHHPFLIATRNATASWRCTPDGRLSPQTKPGILEMRIAPARLDRALAIAQAVISQCEDTGLEVAAVQRGRAHRAGVGIGGVGRFAAVWIIEGRDRVTLSGDDLARWVEGNPWWFHPDPELPAHHTCPRANGKLRLLLPRRHDPPPEPYAGWRASFTDQVGRSLEEQVPDVVAALVHRVAANPTLSVI
jgi:hypothetical protein